MEKVLTSTVLWQDFDAEAEALETNVLNEVNDGEFLLKSVYFTGRTVSDGVSRVLAKVCNKVGKCSKQAIFLIDDYHKPINEEELKFWANNGFVAIAIDFAGRCTKGAHTLYPQSLDYCNGDVAHDYFYIGESVKETKVYEYALNCMRAITYLLLEEKVKTISVITVKKGARVGAIVLGTDSRITNGTVVFNSLTEEFPPYNAAKNSKGWDNNDLEKRLAYEDLSQIWTTGIAPQMYALQIKVPVYFILSANSPYVDLISANKSYLRLNSASRALMLPMVLDYIPDEYIQGVVKWCKGNTAPDDISVKQFQDETGDNYVKVITKLPLAKLTLWYSRNANSRARNWTTAPLKKVEDGYVAELDVYSTDSNLLAFVFVKGAVNCTTALSEIKVTRPRKVKIPTRSLYVGTGEGNLVPLVSDDAWHGNKNKVEYCEGYLNIRGAKSFGLATFAITDPFVRRNENFTVSFDICCNVRQELRVFVMTDYGFSNTVFFNSVKLVGDGKWQRITVDGVKLHKEQGGQMREDEKVQMLAFVANSEFIINNIFLV